ncbi:hypothetical protein ACEPAG_5540 [Sanghuangporus baumii]
MQSQSLRQQTAISSQQSLAVIKTLLSASFGCVAYLRNLLPEENFSEGRLMAGERGSMAYDTQDSPGKNSRHISGITIKTVARGYSTEADKLLNYLEHGIFDAIERQYLKSFIFAIYLDNNDPKNIIESYTFNFTYYAVPGTAVTVPIMSLDDQLNKLSLNPRLRAEYSDPVSQATLKGRAPTLGDVKQSIKSLIKNLVLITQALEPLPKRRFATFKILYRENTPPEYEPPYFRPGDPEKDRFVFTTHDISEIPEKFSIGAVATPHHGIDVQVQSIARFIPNDEKDDSQYLGIGEITNKGFSGSQGQSDAELRAKQVKTQQKDAENRKLAWNVEDFRWNDDDAEGENDPDYANDSGIAIINPLGLRQADGSIVPHQDGKDDAMDVECPVRFFGKPDIVPSRVGELRARRNAQEELEPTQQLDTSQVALSPKPVNDRSLTTTIDTQMLRAALDGSATDWTASNEMLDMESQAMNIYDRQPIRDTARDVVSNASEAPTCRVSDRKSMSGEFSCVCGHGDDDDAVFCEGCEKWLHIRCMGYDSTSDPRLPAKYVCIPCRLQSDIKFDLIKDKYPEILAAFVDLILFRRAIKFVETHNPGSLKEFRKLTKCSASLSEQLWNRLEREGFILMEVIEMDKNGLLETRSRATRSAKKVKSAKRVQKYVFNAVCKNTALYRDYFSPDSEAEKTMIGLGRNLKRPKNQKSEKRKGNGSDYRPNTPLLRARSVSFSSNLTCCHTAPTVRDRDAAEENPVCVGETRDAQLQSESQTQDETQFISMPVASTDLKRRSGLSSQETVKMRKKVKISVVEENVDIEE